MKKSTNDSLLVFKDRNNEEFVVYQRDDGYIIQHRIGHNSLLKFDSWKDWLFFISQQEKCFDALYITEFLIKHNFADSKELLDVTVTMASKDNLKNYINPRVNSFFLKKYPFLVELERTEPFLVNWEYATNIDNEPTLEYIDEIIPVGNYGCDKPGDTIVDGELLVYSNYVLREKDFTNNDVVFCDDFLEDNSTRWYETLYVGDFILGVHFKKEKYNSIADEIIEEQTLLFKNPVKVTEEIKDFPYWWE